MVHCWVACYTIHCDITHANFQNDQAEKTQITRDSQQKDQYTNKQNDHHTFIHSRSHTQTLTQHKCTQCYKFANSVDIHAHLKELIGNTTSLLC